ncbi:MAG: hypothetical protein Q9197_004888 [Variospora fuerteventurae]
MCWPRVEGGLEIEERYPRTNDPREPRRKRLNFVRDRSSPRRSSDDYALVRSSFHQTRPIRAEMQERHDPHLLQQQEMYMRQLQGQNQELQHRLRLEEEQRRRFLIEQARQNHGYPPPPPPPSPGRIGHPHEQQRIMHHPHEGYPDGVEPVEQWQPHPRPHIVEAARIGVITLVIRSTQTIGIVTEILIDNEGEEALLFMARAMTVLRICCLRTTRISRE